MDANLPRPPAGSPSGPAHTGARSPFQIEPVIQAMRAGLDRPLSLNELADGAGWSPFHFHRLFRLATGIPPNEFLTTLRLEEAKRLLLTTSASVTDICFDVGYASLGTFTARFTHLVGATPGRLRRFADTASLPSLNDLGALCMGCGTAPLPLATIGGEIRSPASLPGPIFIGLFPKPIPQARPVGAAVLTVPGRYHIQAPPDGRYYVLAAALPWAEDPRVPALPGTGLLVGTGSEPLLIRHGRGNIQADVTLRPPRLTDPPVVSCLPFLLNQRASRLAVTA